MQVIIKDGTTTVATSPRFNPASIWRLTGIRTSATMGDLGGGYWIYDLVSIHPTLKKYQDEVPGTIEVIDGIAYLSHTATDWTLDRVKATQRSEVEQIVMTERYRLSVEDANDALAGPYWLPITADELTFLQLAAPSSATVKAEVHDESDPPVTSTIDIDASVSLAHYGAKLVELNRRMFDALAVSAGYTTVNKARAWDASAVFWA